MAEWSQRVNIGDIWQDESLPFEETRDRIVERMRPLRDNEFGELEELLDQLAETENADEFDSTWESIYNYADLERIWIDLWASPAS